MARSLGQPAGALIFLATLLVGCTVPAAPAQTPVPAAAPAQAGTATPAPLPTRAISPRTSITADGALAPKSAPIAYAAEGNAKVVSVNVEPGQTVKRGDVLATLDDTAQRDALADAELQLRVAQAEVARDESPKPKEDIINAQAGLASAQAQYELTKRGPTQQQLDEARSNAESAWDNYLSAQVNRDNICAPDNQSRECKLQEAGYGSAFESMLAARASYEALQQPVTQEKLTQAYASVAQAKARLEQVQAGLTDEQKKVNAARLNNAETAVARARDGLRVGKVLSPCTCVIQDVGVSVGAVPKGSAFTLVNLDGMQFKTSNLTERELLNIRVGSAAMLRLKAHDAPFAGRVSAILPQSSGAQGGTALFTVVIDLDPTKAVLLPGMTGQAEIATSAAQ